MRKVDGNLLLPISVGVIMARLHAFQHSKKYMKTKEESKGINVLCVLTQKDSILMRRIYLLLEN